MSVTANFQRQRRPLFGELSNTVSHWQIWVLMGNQDIKLRYKRSVIGPFWISLTLAAWIAGISILYAQILNQPFLDYLVFLSCGLLAWNLISAIIGEGSVSIIDNGGHIRSAAIPLSLFAARVVYRNVIVFFHNLLVIALVLIYAKVPPTPALLILPASLFANAILLYFFISITGPLCARFRDLQQIISNLLQVSFFLTPIIWQPGQMSGRTLITDANPFYHMIELIRAPLMGSLPTTTNLVACGTMLIAGWLASMLVWRYSRKRVIYWL
ncbi:ABC transporter permease [Henriciella sp.]|uniref:ABC transporter permease n=1 Tax=Henriciella sp. TaxID=1968823 RepID=UPI0026194715|nr:ABC transporter permease [Henriciella sp.]